MSIKDVLPLDNGKNYVIASKTPYLENEYYYLANIEDPSDIIICYMEDTKLVEVNDSDTISKLLPLFFEASKYLLGDENNS